MRPSALLVVVLLLLTLPVGGARAQRALEIHPRVGWHLGGKVAVNLDETTSGDLEFHDGLQYGLTADLLILEDLQLQLDWSHQESRLDFDPRGAGETLELFEVGLDYFHLGVNYSLPGEQLVPFLSLGLGTVHLYSQGPELDGSWRFSTVFGAGARYILSDRIALRAQARLYSTWLDKRGELFCDGLGDCYRTFEGGTIIRTEFSAGASFSF